MREKKVLQKTIDKYVDFLDLVKAKAYGEYGALSNIDELIANSQINKSVTKALTDLKMVEFISKTQWTWLVGEPDKQMALKVLDYLLHIKKPTTQPPLFPEWATTQIALLKEISQSLTNLQAKENKGSKGLKLLQEDKLFELVKAIATGVYSKQGAINESGDNNVKIIGAAKGLLKIYNLNNVNK